MRRTAGRHRFIKQQRGLIEAPCLLRRAMLRLQKTFANDEESFFFWRQCPGAILVSGQEQNGRNLVHASRATMAKVASAAHACRDGGGQSAQQALPQVAVAVVLESFFSL